MKHLIINKRGEGYIDTVVEVLVSMILIVLALNVFQFLTLKQDLDHFAKEMITAATVSGRAEAADRYQELAEETGLRPDCSWSADYFDAVKHRVQLGDTTVSYTHLSTVTLLVNETQAKILATQEAKGKMHLALVYRGEASKAQDFLEAQEKVFAGGN